MSRHGAPARAGHPVEPERHLFEDDGAIPNNPRLPFLVYANALDLGGGDPAAVCEAVFGANQWDRSWRNGIYPFPHYHSTAHEVLGICRGEARVRFGGAKGVVMTVRAGDVVVIPAGVGHQNLGAGGECLVVGAYPPGPDWDLCTGKPEERPRVLANIRAVLLPPA
ncbi:MAG: cupin domain-containing protein, partial [Geminicoccaceae bacterium]